LLRILEIWTILWELNHLENDLNRLHSAGPNPAHGYSARRGGLPRTAGRPTGWVMAARSSCGGGRGAGAGCAPDALVAWSSRGGHARGGAVGPRAPADKVSQKR
jgi:hypothetical protein